jgi:hypothetical protein
MFLLTNILLTSLLSQPPLTLDQLKEYVKCLMAERDYVRQQERQIKVQIKSVKEEIMALKQQLKRPAKDVKEVGNKVISTIFQFCILSGTPNLLSCPVPQAWLKRKATVKALSLKRKTDNTKHWLKPLKTLLSELPQRSTSLSPQGIIPRPVQVVPNLMLTSNKERFSSIVQDTPREMEDFVLRGIFHGELHRKRRFWSL